MNQEQNKNLEWKQKFQALSETVEKQEHYQTLLERSLSRLALAAHGIDPALDKHLASLRRFLKSKKNDHDALAGIMKKMEKTIAILDDQKSAQPAVVHSIANLVTQIDWPEKQQKLADKLINQCQSAKNEDLSDMVDLLHRLISQSIQAGSNISDSRGFFSRLFNTEKKDNRNAEAKTSAAIKSLDNKNVEQSRQKQNVTDGITPILPPPHIILITLLEKLTLPDKLGNKATALRLKLEQGLDENTLPGAIAQFADIISELNSAAVNEKKEYALFLKELTDKLALLDQHLRQFARDDREAFEQKQQLNEKVEHEMQEIKTDVETASELKQLKSTLNKRIANLDLHIHTYYRTDHERFRQSQQRIEQLTQRLQQMEDETESLRENAVAARELALKDPLTGIWNRQALNETLEREYERWQRYHTPLTLVVWDVDLFKKVNDRFGHAAGDVVLKTIAQIFSQTTRKSDFIARFGGEEFVGTFPETSLQEGLILANKIRESIQNTIFKYRDTTVPITASAGLASFEEGDNIDDVFNRADKALYQAKKNGRNICAINEK